MIYYQQCKLEKGVQVRVAWIPVKYANKNKYLKIKGDDGWIVKEVYNIIHSREMLLKLQAQSRNTRKASDI